MKYGTHKFRFNFLLATLALALAATAAPAATSTAPSAHNTSDKDSSDILNIGNSAFSAQPIGPQILLLLSGSVGKSELEADSNRQCYLQQFRITYPSEDTALFTQM